MLRAQLVQTSKLHFAIVLCFIMTAVSRCAADENSQQTASANSSPASASADVDYLRDIKPVLRERCFACHGAIKQAGGLRLDGATAISTGGDSGPVIEAGDAADSVLMQRVS
ncbi:MAG: hypothetical protein KDA92_20040, partial [Planctomycetales bacterium]|nr:hypothetical protein [Planctomycetales bacterium]